MKIFECDCGENYHFDDANGMGGGSLPCSCYRVKEMDTLEMIKYVGDEFKKMPFIKYDIFRQNNKWTLIIGNERISNTDNLREVLYTWIKDQWAIANG